MKRTVNLIFRSKSRLRQFGHRQTRAWEIRASANVCQSAAVKPKRRKKPLWRPLPGAQAQEDNRQSWCDLLGRLLRSAAMKCSNITAGARLTNLGFHFQTRLMLRKSNISAARWDHFLMRGKARLRMFLRLSQQLQRRPPPECFCVDTPAEPIPALRNNHDAETIAFARRELRTANGLTASPAQLLAIRA